MNISIVVLSYHKQNRLEVCLDSVIKCLTPDDELIVVDNSIRGQIPDKPIRNFLKDFVIRNQHRVTTQLILNEVNTRFSQGMNQGIERSTKPLVFLLNNDVEVINPDTFRLLAGCAAKDEMVASVTPVTVHSNGSVYCSGAFGTGAHHKDEIKTLRTAQWNNFAFVCLKKHVLDTEGLLETGRAQVNGREMNCRHYHSDEEWCRRVAAKGYVHLVHPVKVKHFYKEASPE